MNADYGRLYAELENLRSLALRDSRVRIIKIENNPPNKYILSLHCKSIQSISSNDSPIYSNEQRLGIYLPVEFPKVPPQLQFLTPTWHPDIAGNGQVHIGDRYNHGWSAVMSLDYIVRRVINKITYEEYDLTSYLNILAAQWASKNERLFPLEISEGQASTENIKISVATFAGQQVVAILPSMVSMEMLLPALAKKIEIPLSDELGKKMLYKLFREKSKEFLDKDDSFQSIGVNDVEDFTLVQEKSTTSFTEEPESRLVNAINISTSFYMPIRNGFTIDLIPSDTVHSLEEFRSTEMLWESMTWVFIGAILGVIINWVTQVPVVISRFSILVVGIFLLMAVISGLAAINNKKHADKIRERIFKYSRPKKSNKRKFL